MTILAIGQNSFLAKGVQSAQVSSDWTFLGHKDAFDKSQWPDDVTCVIGFACDPKVRQGEFSDFDHKLAEAAKEAGATYIMLSSRAVYGISSRPTQLLENQEASKIITPYGVAKKQIEDDLLENFDNIVILRLSNIFGFEYGEESARQTFFGIMLKTLKEEGAIRFSMNMMTQRDFLPVTSFALYLSEIARAPQAGVYNLGAGVGTSVGDMANWVIDGFGKGKIVREERDIIDSFVLDMAKTRSIFSLPSIRTETIRNSCNVIGKMLSEV